MEEWAPLVGAILGAVPVAALVTVGVTFWLRSADRPQVFWTAESLTIVHDPFSDKPIAQALRASPPVASFIIANAGDSPAYSLAVEGVGCEPFILNTGDSSDPRGGSLTRTRAIAAVGEELSIIVRPLGSQPYQQEQATVRLTWVRAPVRHLRYEAQEFAVSDPEAIQLPASWKPPAQGRQGSQPR